MASRIRREDRLAEDQMFEAPSHDEIAARAYAVYQNRGEGHGQALDDWLQAERELLQERSTSAPQPGSLALIEV
ncbi:MAG TPA: DUF2934 domain-containing protein [Vicinamibacterales bacterium]|nr:DUF2934 domain-containing protein [Vicinamibacterales bacterium]